MWENVDFWGIWVKDIQEILILPLQIFCKFKVVSKYKGNFNS